MASDDKVLQSPFEQAVIKIITHLFALPKQVRDFDHKKDLLNDLRIGQNNWGKYQSAVRHIPENLHKHIRDYFINKYHANPSFLDGKSPQMFLTSKLTGTQQPELANKTIITQAMWDEKLTECETLKKENATLLRRIIELQEKLIEAMKYPAKNANDQKMAKG